MNEKETDNDKRRLEGLADGIFAFAMTLLIINLHIPDSKLIHSEANLVQYLQDQSPTILSYVLSFLLLGVTWTGHKAQFENISKSDNTHNWIHILYLMTVTAYHFPQGFLANLPNTGQYNLSMVQAYFWALY